MHSLPWVSLLDILVLVILHVPNFTIMRTTDKDVILPQSTFIYEDSSCNLGGFFVEVAFNDKALGFTVEVNHQIQMLF